MSDGRARAPMHSGKSGATRVRGKARSVLRPSGPPTMPISVRGAGDNVSEWHTRAVIDFALRLGEAMLVTGASVADTTAAVLRVCRAYGMTSVHADITYTSVTISYHRGVLRDPITVMRIVSHFGMDYSRLEALHTLVREICTDRHDPGDIEDNLHELERILDQPHIYRHFFVNLGWAGMGAGVAALMGGSFMMILIGGLTTGTINRVQARLAKVGVSAFFGQILGAAIATTVTMLLLFAKNSLPDVHWLQSFRPSIVIASSIVALLAGMSVVTAAQDTLDGFYVTAGARTYEVVIMTGGIVAGVLAVLSVGHRLGLMLPVVPANFESGSVVVRVLAAALLAGAFAVSAYCGPVTIATSAGAGALAYVIYEFMSTVFGSSQAISSAVAAFIVGLLAPRISQALHVPSIAVTTAGIVPLLPGLAVYKGIMALIQDKTGDSSAPTLLGAALVALALSAGVSLGTLLGRQLMAGENSMMTKVLRRSVAEHTE